MGEQINMKNYYQIFNNWKTSQIEILKSNGLNVQLGFHNIKLYDTELYNKLDPLFKQWGTVVTIGSEFSNDDYSSANHLNILPTWQTQYPQPEDNFAYLEETYDLKNYCSHCGIGAIQKSPFRIKKEIKWSSKVSFVLNWVFDEIFVKKDIYEKVFVPIGIDFVPVLLHKNGNIIEDIKQLKIDETTSRLKLENLAFEKCEECGCKKYDPIMSGYFPDFMDDYNVPKIVKSEEYYGSGGSASKWIIVSQSFRKILLKEKINFTYYPSQ
jgi:hypothetical protein